MWRDKTELGKDAPLCLTGPGAIWIVKNHCLLDTEVPLGILNGLDAHHSPRLQTQALVKKVTTRNATKKETISVELVREVIELHNLHWGGGKVQHPEEK